MRFYKDIKNCTWYEEESDSDSLSPAPFGHYVLTLLNTLNSWESEERFIRNEKIWLNAENKILSSKEDTKNITEDTLRIMYKNNLSCVNKEIWWDDYQKLLNYIIELDSFKKSPQATKDLGAIYSTFKFFMSIVCRDNAFMYEPLSDEYIKELEKKQNELIQFHGYGFISDKCIPCEIYETKEFCDIFILDFWEYLFNPKMPKTRVCKECGVLFVSNNANATYCDLCKENMAKIRYKNRKANKERYLHKQIIDYLYTIDDSKKLSNDFLNESNYYWDIINKKNTEINTSYRTDITTKKDYMEWLKNEQKKFKKGL